MNEKFYLTVRIKLRVITDLSDDVLQILLLNELRSVFFHSWASMRGTDHLFMIPINQTIWNLVLYSILSSWTYTSCFVPDDWE